MKAVTKSKEKQIENQIDRDKALVKIIQEAKTLKERDDAFAAIFKRYKQQITQYMSVNLRHDREQSKDLMMTVFTKIHLSIKLYKPELGAFSTWVYKIAKNCLIDYKRTEKYEVFSIESLNAASEKSDHNLYIFQIIDDTKNNGFDLCVKKERAEFVLEAIESIKNKNVRESIRLRYFEDISYEEISKELKIPIGSVKAYVNRAKMIIEEYIKIKSPQFEG